MAKEVTNLAIQQKNTVSVLKELLKGGNVHAITEQALAQLPADLQDKVPEG